MSLTVEHAVFLRVSFEHAYYTDGLCPDLSVQPISATAELLRRRRCLLRATPCGFSLSCQVKREAGEHVVPTESLLDPGTRMVFAIMASHPSFCFITDLPELSGVGACYQLRNQGPNRDLTFSARPGPTNPDSADPTEKELFALRPLFVLTLDSGDACWPREKEIEKEPGTAEKRKVLDPISFSVRFSVRKSVWRYHVIKTPPANAAPGGPDAYSIRCKQTPAPYPSGLSFTPISQPGIAANFPGCFTSSFESNLEIPFCQRPLKEIELSRIVNGVEDPLIKNLPNPPRTFLNRMAPDAAQPARFLSEVYVHL